MHCNEVWTLIIHTFENVNLPLKQTSVMPTCQQCQRKDKDPCWPICTALPYGGPSPVEGHVEPPAMCENIARRVTHPQPCGICTTLKLEGVSN